MEERISEKSVSAGKKISESTDSQAVDSPTTAVCANMKPVDEMSPITYPYDMGYLPPEFVEKAEQELSETPEKLKEQVHEIRRLLRKEKSLEDEWFSDEVIIMYLRGRKYKTLEIITAIKKMTAFIRKYPQFFVPLDPEVLDEIINQRVGSVLPRRDKDGCMLIVVRLGRWNTSKTSFEDHMRYAMAGLLHSLRDPMTQVNGVRLIYDFQNHSFKYLKYFTPYYIHVLYQIVLECLPYRTKAMHLVNPSMLTKIGISFVFSVCSEKMKSRIFVHNKPDEVANYVQRNVVPIEYGGDLKVEDESEIVWTKTASMPDYVTSIMKSLRS